MNALSLDLLESFSDELQHLVANPVGSAGSAVAVAIWRSGLDGMFCGGST